MMDMSGHVSGMKQKTAGERNQELYKTAHKHQCYRKGTN